MQVLNQSDVFKGTKEDRPDCIESVPREELFVDLVKLRRNMRYGSKTFQVWAKVGVSALYWMNSDRREGMKKPLWLEQERPDETKQNKSGGQDHT